MQSFVDLGVSRAVVDSLAQQGITRPFAIQSEVIGDALAGRDVLARSPTGSGKTLAFGIPLVERVQATDPRPSALVLAPTRELATQIVEDIRPIAHARALRVSAVYGGVGLVKQAREAARSHLLVATPGRLEDLLARAAFTLEAVRLLVLDEADRMLDMGFRPAVDRIIARCPAARQTLFFSATLDGEAGRLARAYTGEPAVFEIGSAKRRASADVEHRFVPIAHEHRVEALIGELRCDRGLTIVFVRTKRGADRLVKRLAAHGVEAAAMHANKSQRQREETLARFESGAIDTLVATDIAARGIDISAVSHVINFDPPADSETYVHRTGRTGRAGARGIAITLVAPAEHDSTGQIATTLGLHHTLTTTGPGSGGPARSGGRSRSGGRARSGGRPRSAGNPGAGGSPGAGAKPRGGRRRAG